MHRNDIQGMRAIAVLVVLLFHTFPHTFPGGFIGVDIFFVISGYLITGIIFRETLENRFSIANFYRRRVRRIFPALFVVLFSTALASYFILSPTELVSMTESAISAIFSVSNIYFWRTSGYFASEAAFKPLLHTWSLGVEEQFYIFLPVIMIVILRYFRRYIVWFFITAFIVSLILSELLLSRSTSATYFLLPTRSFELLAGSILAVTNLRLSGYRVIVRNAMAITGLAMIMVPLFAFSESTPFPGVNALYPTLGAVFLLVAGAGNQSIAISNFISTSGFRFFGNISYSLYLWHWPVLALLRVVYGHDLPWHIASGALIATTLLAYLSYRFVEQPFMNTKMSNLPYLKIGTACMIASTIALMPFIYTGGVPTRFSAQSLAFFASENDYNPERSKCHSGNGAPIQYAQNCIFGDMMNDKVLAVWGDSHGAELAYALGQRSKQLDMNVMEITASSCPPSLNYKPSNRRYCVGHNLETLRNISSDSRIDVVVLALNGVEYSANKDTLKSGLTKSVESLLAAGKQVLLIEQLPTFSVSPPITLGYASFRNENISHLGKTIGQYNKETMDWNNLLRGLSNMENVSSISVTDALCKDEFCPFSNEVNDTLYFNKNHISLVGADIVAEAVIHELSTLTLN